MLIKRIKATNYKTYLDLDVDISVQPDRPIVLIGGANGGGKTTFFEAIYGALYGLKIGTKQKFREFLNADLSDTEGGVRIVLELHFSGKVLNQEQNYVLTRTYALNPESKPVESVKLNMNGTIFQYGSATPAAQRAESESQINKIIKANLPQELSRYFLFDAMEAGNLLREDQLNRVIKENIENVMGFNKYLNLSKSAENLLHEFTTQRLKLDNERKEYTTLLEEKRANEEEQKTYNGLLLTALNYSVSEKEIYDNLKGGLNQDETIKNKIEQLETQLANTRKREDRYRSEVEEFSKNIENHVFLPKLADTLKSDIALILKAKNEAEASGKSILTVEQIEAVAKSAVQYLSENKLLSDIISLKSLVEYVQTRQKDGNTEGSVIGHFEASEIVALEKLVNAASINPYPNLNEQQIELDMSIAQMPLQTNQKEKLKAQISGKDYTLLKAYEDNEGEITRLKNILSELKTALVKIEKRVHQFDIQTPDEPDPRYEALQRLRPFFEQVANKLLKTKKEQIELRMKNDLNKNLAAYRDVIDRVELSENLKDLTFKIYHISGNELYLNQLNTASKQVVIQVLLKTLHEFGDYDPPVMIDTVMGVLDETSRATVLENYFPELAEQVILLSSDSEIRTATDFVKIEPFISKAYTLERNKERQKTDVIKGYFGKNVQND